MQFLVNENLANKVFHTAPAIDIVEFKIKRHAVRLVTFDYGLPMGWAQAGHDVRARVFLDGNALPPFAGLVWARFRPDWLPKSISVKQWNDALSQQFKQLNLG